MKKVRKYNFNTALDKMKEEDSELKEKLDSENLHTRDTDFIIVGTNGILISVSHEGVHYMFKSLEEKYEIGLWEKPTKHEDGTTSTPIFPKYNIKVKIKYLMENSEYEEYDIKNMVRHFGSRLDTNYAVLLESLKEIGLNLKEYNTVRRDCKTI